MGAQSSEKDLAEIPSLVGEGEAQASALGDGRVCVSSKKPKLGPKDEPLVEASEAVANNAEATAMCEEATKTAEAELPPIAVVFIDMPDPDNFVCALATYKLLSLKQEKNNKVLHVVITGRPTNLESKSLTPQELGAKLKAGAKIGDLLKRGSQESDNLEHAQRVLEDGSVCLSMFLERHGIARDSFRIYNGGIAPVAPVSHRMHAREFLFDRGDLIDPSRPQGSIISSSEYYKLVKQFDDIEDAKERANETLKLLRRKRHDTQFLPLTALLDCVGSRKLKLVVGGPTTAVRTLLSLDGAGQKIASQIIALHGMYGAWDNAKPGSFNLFPNQFNVAADIEAAQDLLIHRRFGFPMYFVPTETCKDKRLSVTPEMLKATLRTTKADLDGDGSIVKMYELWFNIQGRRPFFIFDMAPVLSASEKYESIYKMVPIRARYLSEQGVLRIVAADSVEEEANTSEEDRAHPRMLMADRNLSDEAVRKYYRALAEVFDTEEELPTCPTPTVAASVGEEDKGSAAAEQKAAPIAAVQKVVEVKQSPITIKSDEKITAVKAA